MGILKQLGKGAVNAATGGMSGIIDQGVGMLGEAAFGDYMRDKEYEQYQRTANYQATLSEQAASKAFQRQMDMYNVTKNDNLPGTKVKQFQNAGLNVGLMYGQNGGVNMMGQLGGGTQSNPSGGQMGNTGGVPRGGMVNAQLAMMETERENVQANTNLANSNADLAQAEADKTRGVDTDLANQEIANKKAQEELAKSGKLGQDIVNEKLGIERDLAKATFDDNVEIAKLTKEELSVKIKEGNQAIIESSKRIVKMNSEIYLNYKEGKIKDQELQNAKMTMMLGARDMALKKVQIDAAKKGIQLTDEQINKIKKEMDKIDAETDIIGKENEYFVADKFINYTTKLISAGCIIAGVALTATGAGAAVGLPLVAAGATGMTVNFSGHNFATDGNDIIFAD